MGESSRLGSSSTVQSNTTLIVTRYLDGDWTLQIAQDLKRKQYNVNISLELFLESFPYFNRRNIMYPITLRNIQNKEELFVDLKS